MTASPPLIFHAAEGSRRTMRAYGCGERSVAPHRTPSAPRSDENANRPCTFGSPSGRGGLCPIPRRTRVSTVVSVIGSASRRGLDRSEDPAVAGAPAQVARQRLADLDVRRVLRAIEEVVHGH